MKWNELELPDGIKPYYQDEWVTIYHGDCREILPQLSDKSVDLVLTSPPFNQTDKIGRGRKHTARWHRQANTAGWYPDNLPFEDYYWQQVTILTQLAQKVVSNGSVIYHHKPDYRNWRTNHPLDWIKEVKTLALVQEVIWSRPGGIAVNCGRFIPSHEVFYWLCRSDSKPRPVKTHCKKWCSVWFLLPDREMPQHPAALPVEVVVRFIEALTDMHDLILDPFLGSGTTCYCAKKLNRYSIGIEIEEKYCEIAANRCRQMVFDFSEAGKL